ncbi:MAG TPA: CBS domain-containing protein [Solirubrobacterales bacterium]|jgi:CBS domain-containing protein|nr:CBS domain-containing protein [Solirubrobacterales bacterium]
MADSIRDVMTPDPATFTPDQPVAEAAKAMSSGDFGAVVVVENGGGVRGILTDRDIVVRAVAEGKDPTSTEISEVFTTEPTTLSPDDSLDQAVNALRDNQVRRLPVVEGSEVVGIVSIGDLAQARDEKSALADISAAEPNN